MSKLNWLSPKQTGRSGVISLISFASRAKSKDVLVGVITFSEQFMKEVGWVSGDRIQFAQEGDFIFMRRNKNGYTLSPYTDRSKQSAGKAVSCAAVIPQLHFENRRKKYVDKYEVFEGGVVSFSTE